jgi:hypothetical protein
LLARNRQIGCRHLSTSGELTAGQLLYASATVLQNNLFWPLHPTKMEETPTIQIGGYLRA